MWTEGERGAVPEAPWMVLFTMIFVVFSIIVIVVLCREMKSVNV